ncbi:MAG: hypothetical protein ACJAVK_002948, partial [Akkermansiaceae bacterium]
MIRVLKNVKVLFPSQEKTPWIIKTSLACFFSLQTAGLSQSIAENYHQTSSSKTGSRFKMPTQLNAIT